MKGADHTMTTCLYCGRSLAAKASCSACGAPVPNHPHLRLVKPAEQPSAVAQILTALILSSLGLGALGFVLLVLKKGFD